jgi:hypothetical protein
MLKISSRTLTKRILNIHFVYFLIFFIFIKNLNAEGISWCFNYGKFGILKSFSESEDFPKTEGYDPFIRMLHRIGFSTEIYVSDVGVILPYLWLGLGTSLFAGPIETTFTLLPLKSYLILIAKSKRIGDTEYLDHLHVYTLFSQWSASNSQIFDIGIGWTIHGQWFVPEKVMLTPVTFKIGYLKLNSEGKEFYKLYIGMSVDFGLGWIKKNLDVGYDYTFSPLIRKIIYSSKKQKSL